MSLNLSNISVNNFSNICRTCSQTNDLVSMRQNTYLIGMLSTLTDIQIQLTDELPKMICLNCVKDLNKSYSFVSKCKATDVALRQCLNKQKVLKYKEPEPIIPKMTEEIFIKTEITDIDEYIDPLSDEGTQDPLEYPANNKEEFEVKSDDAGSNAKIKQEGPKGRKKRATSAINNVSTKNERKANANCEKRATEGVKNTRRKRTKNDPPSLPNSAKENEENTENYRRIHEPLVLLKVERHKRIN